jgi:hypothetical protein
MYGTQNAGAVKQEISQDPIGPVILKTFEINIERMHQNISRIEDQCHSILNLRHPQAETKSETQMENDLNSAISNRMNTWSILNDRLDAIVMHLNRIVG